MMLGAFIGGWELLLILVILGGIAAAIPLTIFAVIYVLKRQQRGSGETAQRGPGH
jgi:hypothetical protein